MLDKKRVTIHKSTILNWLHNLDEVIDLADLAKWLEAKSDGRYKLIEQSVDQTPEILSNIPKQKL